MISTIARALGLNALAVYAIIAVALIGSVWGYGHLRYRAGLSEGALTEQVKWLDKMAEVRAENERKRQAAQAQINRIESEFLSQQKRAAEAETALEEIIHEIETDAPLGALLPRKLSNQLNATGR
ncbi:hypothetical protein [Pseudaminobacter soli (ex Li et al. 2025)]|uniref:Uncharacterized protein n=1 Tax=Pseudaminobacter soli (ex Li et al. 2025) TaxID=1295366 RepID=A0A2P7SDZ4_9HYPH|nr:hypothetical protein [Mesorhizobium soli]PSJ60734.1 hypothetical protein C7I85_11870 [Mesorhizobium soli]